MTELASTGLSSWWPKLRRNALPVGVFILVYLAATALVIAPATVVAAFN